MDITFNPKASQISKLYTARFADPEENEAGSVTTEPEDQLNISQEGQDAAAKAEGGIGFDEMAEKLEAWVGSMTKEDFMALMREQLGGPQQLEINWNAQVDPDGSVWAKSYIDSLASQVETARSAIKDYYAGAYQEALNSPLGSSLPNQLNFLAGKYMCSWSDFFDSSMPADERQWTYNQVKAMLTGGHVKLNDPYALAGSGLDVKNMDDVARKAASDKIQELIQQAKEAAGVSLD